MLHLTFLDAQISHAVTTDSSEVRATSIAFLACSKHELERKLDGPRPANLIERTQSAVPYISAS